MPRFEALYCFFPQKYGERRASQIAQKIDQLAQHINSESQDLTIKALVLSEAKTNQKHKVYINLAQNDNTYGILTDYNNARRHEFYKREQIIEKLTIKKDSTILAADKSEFEIAPLREINENSSSIIWWAIVSNSNKDLLNRNILILHNYLTEKLKHEEWWNALSLNEKYECVKILTYDISELPLFNWNNEQ